MKQNAAADPNLKLYAKYVIRYVIMFTKKTYESFNAHDLQNHYLVPILVKCPFISN